MTDDETITPHERIARATDAAALAAAVETARSVAEQSARERVPLARVAEQWSAVVRSAVAAAAGFAGVEWFWYVSGSTGRGEALPGSDVETLVVIPDDGDVRAAAAAAASVHSTLDRCGLPGDDRGAIAARSRFCRTASEWSAGVTAWTTDPAADRGVVMAGLLADTRPVADGPDLCGAVGTALRSSDRGLALMLTDSLSIRAQLPSRMRIFGSRDDHLDIKTAALQPITSIARWAACSADVDALPTAERLRAAAGTRFLDADDAESLVECHRVATRIRWEQRHSGSGLTFAALPPHDRAAIRGVGRELDRIRRKLAFLSSTSSFTA